MSHLRLLCLMLAVLPLFATGCCCVQGVPNCSTGTCGTGTCGTGTCGPGPIASLASCRGGCGDVYVDEWVSEPPTVDHCCQPNSCGSQPVRNILRALWGQPYGACCPNDLVGPSCGCDSCGGGSVGGSCDSGCCSSGSAPMHSGVVREVPQNATQMKVTPTESAPEEVTPTPAPEIDPMASRGLNPAQRRRAVRTASARYQGR